MRRTLYELLDGVQTVTGRNFQDDMRYNSDQYDLDFSITQKQKMQKKAKVDDAVFSFGF